MHKLIALYLCCAVLSCVFWGQLSAQDNRDSLYKATGPKDYAQTDTTKPDTIRMDSATLTTTQTDSSTLVSTQGNDTQTDTTQEPPWYIKRSENPDAGPLTVRSVRRLSDSTMNVLRKDDDFWYVAVGREKKKPVAPQKEHDYGKWLTFAVWTILCGLGVALIVAFIQYSTGEYLFKRKRNTLVMEEGPGGIIPPHLEAAFQAAVEQGDYAAAERYLFLLALDGLGSKNLIVPGREKSNREYLRELRDHSLYSDFARLVRHYEYTFYGGFALGQAAFTNIHRQYEQFQNRLQTL